MDKHKIVFTGSLVDGFHIDSVKADFSNLFKLDNKDKLEKIFSGGQVTIKAGLDAEKATKFLDRLKKIGLVAEIHPPIEEKPSGLELSLEAIPDSKPEEPESSSVASEAGGIKFDIPEEGKQAESVEEQEVEPADNAGDAFGGLSLEPMPEKEVKEEEPEKEAPMQSEPIATGDGMVGAKAARVAQSVGGSAAVAAAASMSLRGNDSGSGKGAVLPDEAKGLCWGAFFLNVFWGLRNKVYIALLAFIPYVNILVAIYLLIKGRELSWQNQKWDSVEEFNKSQKIWGWVGFILGLIPFIILTMGVSKMNDELDRLEAMTPEEKSAYEQQQDEEMQKAIDDIDDPKLKEQMKQLREQMREMKMKRENQKIPE